MVVGYIHHFKNERHALVKVVAYKNNGVLVKEQEKIDENFPVRGYVFEPDFKSRYSNFVEDDYISFVEEPNPYSINGGAEFKIKSRVQKVEYQVIDDNNLPVNQGAINIEYLQNKIEELPDKFYIKNGQGFYGPFKKERGEIKPKTGTTVEFRSSIDCIISSHKNDSIKYIFVKPGKPEKELDASNSKQLQDWFKEFLKKSDSEFWKQLFENTNWREDLLMLSNKKSHIEKAKLDKVINNLLSYELTLQELDWLACTSINLLIDYNKLVNQFKEEIIIQKEGEINAVVEDGKYQLQIFDNQKTEIQNTIIQLKEEKKQIENDCKYLVENKERLLADFKVLSNISSLKLNDPQYPVSPVSISKKKTYTLEESDQKSDLPKLKKKEFDQLVSELLRTYRKTTSISNFTEPREIITSFNSTLSHSLEFALSFIRATNNYRYILCQIEVKWLSFKDLWENGLEEIWQSAYNDSERLHFFILRDINLSSPECYARPLLDIDAGLRERMPFDERKWPKNLRIIGTKQSCPEIGLPILSTTFKNWGGLPEYELEDCSLKHAPEIKGMISLEKFLSWRIEDRLELPNDIEKYFDER